MASTRSSAVGAPSEPQDAFPAGPNVAAYVPTPASEQGLAYLAAKLLEAPTIAGISGASGTGRSMLLRLLLVRLSCEFEATYIPTGRLSAGELSAWVEAQRPPSIREPRPGLIGIDDADDLDALALQWLRSRVELHGTRIVLVLCDADERSRDPIRAALSTRIFTEPLGLGEALRHIETRLAEAGAALPLATVERIALASQGNQQSIHQLADAELFANRARERTRTDPGLGNETPTPAASPVGRRAEERTGFGAFCLRMGRRIGAARRRARRFSEFLGAPKKRS